MKIKRGPSRAILVGVTRASTIISRSYGYRECWRGRWECLIIMVGRWMRRGAGFVERESGDNVDSVEWMARDLEMQCYLIVNKDTGYGYIARGLSDF